jgi:cold shock CspA family protein
MQGIVTHWNKQRAYGFVRTSINGKHESYFLHLTEITEGPLVPSIGDTAEFEVAPPRIPGKLPNAIKVKITAPAGGAQ